MSNANQRLLLVEDSPTQLIQMRILLEAAGFEVATASNGREGFESAQSAHPLLVVTDMNMPEVDGLELVALLNDEMPQVPVVLTTSQGSEEVAAEALRRGAASYVPKKRIEQDLVMTVERLLAVSTVGQADSELLKLVTHKEVTFQLSNDDALIPRVIGQFKELMRQLDLFEERELVQISTALDEALLNAIVHGNLEVCSELRELEQGCEYRRLTLERRQTPPYCQRSVWATARLTRDQVTFIIRDEGQGFDPSQIPDPTDPANLEKPSGRGLLLINAFMDDVTHNEQGNEITMLKRKSQPEESLDPSDSN